MDKQAYKDYLASRIISFDKKISAEEYDKVYYRTNEDLLDTYLDVDFYDKEVFSVMASADQVLTARYLDAKRVDAYDKNRLTKYYFYLRIWAIEYDNRLYPNVYSLDYLRNLLIRVHPKTKEERAAYDYYLKHIKAETDVERLFYEIDAQPQGRTLYTEASELSDCLSPKIDFYEYDMFKENSHPRQYDIVITSNILDWARHDKTKLKTAAYNLKRLTKKNGYILGSNLINKPPQEVREEIAIMQEYFDLEEVKSKSYVYRKK